MNKFEENKIGKIHENNNLTNKKEISEREEYISELTLKIASLFKEIKRERKIISNQKMNYRYYQSKTDWLSKHVFTLVKKEIAFCEEQILKYKQQQEKYIQIINEETEIIARLKNSKRR